MQSINTIALKLVKVSKLVRRKLIRYRSLIGSGAFRQKYFGDIPRPLLCVLGFDHKAKIPQKHIFAVLLLDRTTWAVASQGMQDHFGAKSANWLVGWLSKFQSRFQFHQTKLGRTPGTRFRLAVTSGQMHTKEKPCACRIDEYKCQ